jgi:hypothetical protein
MTPAQKRAMRPYRKELKQAFAEAAPTAATPGKARTWFVPYLVAVFRTYRKLTTQIVDGRPLSKVLAKQSRRRAFQVAQVFQARPQNTEPLGGCAGKRPQIRHLARTIPDMAEKGRRCCRSCVGAIEGDPRTEADRQST